MRPISIAQLRWLSAITVATLIGAGEAKGINPVALDTFDVDHNVQGQGSTDTVSGPSDEIIGGSREIEISQGNGATETTAGSESNNNLVFNSDDSVATNELILRYDSGSGDATSLNQTGIDPAINLTGPNDNNTGLLFKDLTGFGEVKVDLFSSNAQGSETFTFNSINTPTDKFIKFKDNQGNNNFGDVNLDQITAAQLTINETSGGTTNITLDSVNSTNPNPIPFEAETSIGLALLGAWGAYKRWKNKQKGN